MPPRDLPSIQEKLNQTSLKIDSFFLRQTGFVSNQTVLRLGEYTLNCVPAMIGGQSARFLAVLTPTEVSLFSKFKGGTHILILTFDDADSNDIARFPVRVNLTDLVPVPNRKNVCLLLVKFKSLPAELIQFLGAFLEELEARQAAWEALTDHEFDFDAPTAQHLAAGSGFVLASSEGKLPVELATFHTKRVVFRSSQQVLSWAGKPGVQLRMTFRSQALNLEGTLDAQGVFLPEFQPDWLELVEICAFQRNLKNKAGMKKGPVV